MTDHYSRLWLQDLFRLVPGAKREFEKNMGIDLDKAPSWLISGGINILIENEEMRRHQEREDEIRREDYEFQAKMEQAKAEALRVSLYEVANIIRESHQEDTERLEKLLTTIQEGYKSLPPSGDSNQLAQGKYLPTHITYLNCWRKHSKTEDFPAGRPGPSQCIYTMHQTDGIHYRCLVAYASQHQEGFARLSYQIFHAELLRQGDCPKPLSRSITRRIPGLSWLLVRPDICPLADGGDYILQPGGKFKRGSD